MFKQNCQLLLTALVIALVLGGCNRRMAVKPGTYGEQHRPQWHFSPPQKWMNDPNGMFFYEGNYHLFYQHYPEASVWGPMHWGHAVSKDLVHWENLPIAIYPDSLGYIFSGSAVVDRQNSSGLGSLENPPIVAVYTIHDMVAQKAGRLDCESQGIAFSLDKGKTWTKYGKNPVLPNPGNIPDFRDPKVSWDPRNSNWIMALAAGDVISFWSSKNLISWEHLSDFGKGLGAHGGVWECPDLFRMKVEGTNEHKWVLVVNLNPGGPNGGSGTQYFVGEFNGRQFIPDASFLSSISKGAGVWLDYGRDNYAGVTWSDIPESDGRRILIGWMSNWDYSNVVPTETWRNAATLPRSLTLHKTKQGYRVFSNPIKELQSIRGKEASWSFSGLKSGQFVTPKLPFSPSQSEWDLELELPEGSVGKYWIELFNDFGERYRIGYDAGSKQLLSDRTKSGPNQFSDRFARSIHAAPLSLSGSKLRLHLLFDVASVEVFAEEGSTVMTELFFPTRPFTSAKLVTEGGDLLSAKGRTWHLKRVWPK